MKAALKYKRVYIIGLVLLILGLGTTFGVLGITLIPTLNVDTFYYPYLLWIFGVGYMLVGYLWCDILIAVWRKKTGEWDSPADPQVKEKGWVARWTFWLPGIVILIVCLVFEVIGLIMGHYPFL